MNVIKKINFFLILTCSLFVKASYDQLVTKLSCNNLPLVLNNLIAGYLDGYLNTHKLKVPNLDPCNLFFLDDEHIIANVNDVFKAFNINNKQSWDFWKHDTNIVLIFSPDKKLVANIVHSHYTGSFIYVYCRISKNLLWESSKVEPGLFEAEIHSNVSEAIGFSPNNSFAIVDNGIIKIYGMAEKANIQNIPIQIINRKGEDKPVIPYQTIGFSDGYIIKDLQFSPDGKYLACLALYEFARHTSSHVLIYDLEADKLVNQLSFENKRIIDRMLVSSIKFFPKQPLVIIHLNNSLYFWNFSNNEIFNLLAENLNCYAISPQERYLALAINKEIKLWNTISKQYMQVLRGHNNLIRSIAFSHDGKYLATACQDGYIQLYTNQLPINETCKKIEKHKLDIELLSQAQTQTTDECLTPPPNKKRRTDA